MLASPEQVCLPEPGVYRMSGQPLSADAAELRWRGDLCPRVQALADRLLSGQLSGPIDCEIERIESGPPQLDDDESYALQRDADGLTLRAQTTWGGLRAIVTLYQLGMAGPLPAELEIRDAPRFAWRGVLIDVARHFISLAKLKEVVQGMALVKLNVLHLHLSDDQGFRFASKRYPGLASEQHYTPSELADLVSFAGQHGVRVIPELDVPGHVNSWLVAYPEWGYQQVSTTDRFGVHAACLDVSNPAVISAVEHLFTEVTECFVDSYVHIGGDEVHQKWWAQDPNMQRYAESQGLNDPGEIQNAFNRQLVDYLHGLGKKVIGWDEVLHDDMPALVVQNWRGVTTRDQALNKGLDCIVSAPYYLDLHYAADMYYAFDPEGDQQELIHLEDQQQADPRLTHVAAGIEWTRQWRNGAESRQPTQARVLGGEACMWSELVNEAVLDVRLWSRLPAIAERLWSPADVNDVPSLYRRLSRLLALPDFQLAQKEGDGLRAIGLNDEEIEVVRLLEPVKWYGRLLGEEALRARIAGREMPQARPYTLSSPLNDIVDLISPESLTAYQMREASWSQWRQQAEKWRELKSARLDAELPESIAALRRFGGLLADQGQTADQASVEACYGPHDGELMLAVVPSFLSWQQAR